MALKQLGSSYMVGADSAATSMNDSTIYRGSKDFLIWNTAAGARVSLGSIAIGNAFDEEQSLTAEVYRLGNLLDDPGTKVSGEPDPFEVEAGTEIATASFQALPQTVLTEGLYRLRINPESNHLLYKVRIQSPWYSLECSEPRYGFYVFGAGTKIFKHYFFVPHLGEDETVRVRLAVEAFNDAAALDIYKLGSENDPVLTLTANGRAEPVENAHLFAIGEIPAEHLPTADPGGIYVLKLSRPGQPGHPPAGNTWVRFSRNVPQYLSPSSSGLIYPILHKDFDPVMYDEDTGTQRVFLTVDRTAGIFDADCNLSLIVESTETPGTSTGYVDSLEVTVDTGEEAGGPRQVTAEGLLQDGDIVKAEATDKIDATYYVDTPEYGTDWNASLRLAYDHGNGRNTSLALVQGGFNTVQTNDWNTIDIISDARMKAVGALYSGNIKADFYCTSRENAMSSKVRFWMIWDEPDAGTGCQVEKLGDMYSRYLEYNKHANKPYSVNISQPVYLEDYAKGCDVVICDPFLKSEKTNKVTDSSTEVVRVAGSAKKAVIILYWWYPDDPSSANNAAALGASFDAAKAVEGIDGIGGWNFSQLLPSGKTNRLDTYDASDPSAQIPLLWAKIQEKNWTFAKSRIPG